MEGRPRISPAEAVEAARKLYGLEVGAEPLPGERDRNFRLEAETGERWVLKVSRAGEDPDALRGQNAALARLREADTGYAFPRLLPDRSGREIARIEDRRGREHAVRLLGWVPGRPLFRFRPHRPELLEEVGTLLGRVDRALEGWHHPGADRPFYWDLRGAREEIARHASAVEDPGRRALLDRHLEAFERHGAPLLPGLRTGTIHGDGNDHNLLVSVPDDPRSRPRVAGLVDFGDMVESWVAAEPAVGIAYAMLGKTDPLEAAVRVAAGYHRERPLHGGEADALFPLACLRLCLSVVLAAHQRSRMPENPYLSVSEGPAWALLERLIRVSPRWARARIREGCGLPPASGHARAEAWLRSRRELPAPVLDPAPREGSRAVLDLSVGSPEGPTGAPEGPTGAPEGPRVGIGRYGEVRRWCTSEAFRVETDAGPEWRTVHLGLDLVVPPGTPVLAPLDGIVEDGRSDGVAAPSVLLRHEPAEGIRFHTLLRGLEGADVRALEIGGEVSRGHRLGSVAGPTHARPGPPRLHVQIVLDPVGRGAGLPGVARPATAAAWRRLCPDPNLLLRIPDLEPAGRDVDGERILAARRRRLGPNLSVSYDRPLHIVRGRMQHLVDAEGRAYLDGVNNVAHVGHSHPRVLEALRRQAAVLNTNTRYLHPLPVRYAERLATTLPDPLRVCWFVCSGSEANELALRLARAHTGSRGVVVIDGAYHGNTSSLIELSPYKFAGPGGEGAPSWVWTVPMPDPYRGRHRGTGPETGARYAAHVRDAARDARSDEAGLAAFFCEPLLGCGGQVVPPEGYLAEAFAAVREAGGVCVADEVQIGFGRVGTRFWGFETQGVVPDIVTLGKPMGNGHPLGAVVTTPEIAASFDTGMEYFNTFGGNPVSCAVGLAVLDVIEEEGLQDRALRVGARLRQGLEAVMERHPLIGDVRGRGLFLGVQLVTDREDRAPAPRHAAYVVERMRELGILLSTDGPEHDVVKIKPPLAFSEEDADRLVETLDRVLGEDPVRVG